MPKSRYALNAFILSELKSQIAIKLCFPIMGKPDCIKLSEILLKEGFGSISVTTLYRLFVNFNGIIPYQNTLNVLVNYIGYSCWSDFVEKIDDKNHNYSINQQKDISNNLIFHCIETGATKSLTSYFESIENLDYKFKVKVALDVYDSLLHVKRPELFFSKFYTNKFVKSMVLEDAFDPAFRIKNYDYAYNLYCKNSTINNSLEAIQDYVFSQSVLFRHYFLIGNLEKAFAIGTKLYSKTTITKYDLDTIFIFPNIRFRAYKIWYYQLIGTPKSSIEDYVIELMDYCENCYNSLDSLGKKIVFHCIAEVFCYSEMDRNYHILLKEIFKNEFSAIPNCLFEKPLKKSLPYFEPNGLLHYRPLK